MTNRNAEAVILSAVRTPSGSFQGGYASLSAMDLGAVGGNIGHLDGSVSWRAIKKMKLRRGSQQYGTDGCWAMW